MRDSFQRAATSWRFFKQGVFVAKLELAIWDFLFRNRKEIIEIAEQYSQSPYVGPEIDSFWVRPEALTANITASDFWTDQQSALQKFVGMFALDINRLETVAAKEPPFHQEKMPSLGDEDSWREKLNRWLESK